MPYENLSASINNSEFSDIQNNLNKARLLMPFLVNLTKKEKKKKLQLGKSELPMLQRVQQYLETNGTLGPSWLSKPEYDKDIVLIQQLTEIRQLLAPLLEGVDDTLFALQKEALTNALNYHKSVLIARKNNVPGADAIHDDLAQYLPSRKRKMKTIAQI